MLALSHSHSVSVESIHVGSLTLFWGGGGGLFVDKLTHLYLIICIIQQYSVCHCVYHRGDPVLMTGR